MQLCVCGAVPEADVAEAETLIGARFPEPYRSWLIATGGAKVHDLAMPEPGGASVLLDFLPPDEIAQGYRDGFAAWIPPRCVEIGSGAGGGVAISLSGSDAGRIYWADYDKALDLDLDEESYSANILIELAPDWNAFLGSR